MEVDVRQVLQTIENVPRAEECHSGGSFLARYGLGFISTFRNIKPKTQELAEDRKEASADSQLPGDDLNQLLTVYGLGEKVGGLVPILEEGQSEAPTTRKSCQKSMRDEVVASLQRIAQHDHSCHSCFGFGAGS